MCLNFILVPLLIFLGFNGLDWLVFLFSPPQNNAFQTSRSGVHIVGTQLILAELWRAVVVYNLNQYNKNDLHTTYRSKQIHFWFFICDDQVIPHVFLSSW